MRLAPNSKQFARSVMKNNTPSLSHGYDMAFERELECYVAKESYVEYVQFVHGGRWKRARHLDLVCEELRKQNSSLKSIIEQHGLGHLLGMKKEQRQTRDVR